MTTHRRPSSDKVGQALSPANPLCPRGAASAALYQGTASAVPTWIYLTRPLGPVTERLPLGQFVNEF